MINRVLILAISMALMIIVSNVFAEVVIRAKDGRTFTVPLRCDEVQSIEFSGDSSTPAHSQGGGKEITDYKGNKIFLPCGDMAFADRLVSFNVGNPAPIPSAMNPGEILGDNNYNETKDKGYVTLGCGGSITVEFTKVYLVDKSGPDLYVFEIGPAVEPTRLEISAYGTHWIDIGRVSGGKASVDISRYVSPGQRFRFVRLTDLKTGCSGDWPGADIDAVAALGCVERR